MAIYKVQGPNGEIITIEGPDGANPDDVIAQAQSLYRPRQKTTTDYVKDFGKATASMADTGLNMVTGALDYAAYPLARAFGRTPEQATAETSSPKDVIGSAFGITQDPAYRGEASRRAMTAVGEGVQAVARPISTATGLPGSDVENMLGSGMLLAGARAQPYINRAGQSVAKKIYDAEPYITGALKAPIKAPVQFARGAVEGLVNKQYNPATSAMAALQDTYIPPAAAQRFMGEIPGVPPQSISQLQSQARPTSELVGNRMGRVAQAISPKTLTGETLVPLQGQGMQAFGERVGRGVRTNPLQAMGEVGLTALTGIPFKTLGQGIGELGARYLGNKTGFVPGFQNRMTAAQQQAAQQQAFTPPPGGGGFTAPPGGYGRPPPPPGAGNGPIAPGQIPPVTPAEAAKQAALSRVQQQMSQTTGMTNPVNAEYLAAARRYQPASQTRAEQMQAAAAERITPAGSPSQSLAATPRGQELLAQLKQRAQASGAKYTPPTADTPTVAPVAPTDIPPAIATLAPQTTLDRLRSNLTPQTPEQIAAVEAYNAKTPAEKSAQTRAENAAKSVVETPAPVVQSTMTKAQQAKADAYRLKQDEMMQKVQTPYKPGITGESESAFNALVDHMRNRPYMAGVERAKTRTKSTGEVFTPTALVDEILTTMEKNNQLVFKDPTKTYLDPAAGDGQFLSEVVLRKVQNGSTHKQALETTYGVDLMPDNVKILRDRLLAGREDLRPIVEQNILVGNSLKPLDRVPGQTALDHQRMVELFGEYYTEPTKKSSSKKAPPGVINMIPEEGTGTLKTGDARFNGGTYDNPLPHTQALDKIEMFEGFKDLLLPEQKVNIVGGTGTENYIVRKLPNGNLNRAYERKKTGNDRFNESIDDMTYADGGPNKIIWEHPSGYDYTFIGGTLERIVDHTNPATPTYTPTSRGWDKLPKVSAPDVIDIIRKIKE